MASNDYTFENADGSMFRDGGRVVSLTAATVTLNRKHQDKLLRLDRAAGITATLPAARGTGAKFRVAVGTALTSNNYIVKVASASDYMRGQAWVIGAANAGFMTSNTGTLATESDTATMNGTTTGGVVGSIMEFEDVAKNVWRVECSLSGSGTAATPFSAGV